jgi:hypothetical protein
MKRNATIGTLAIACLLSWPLKSSAQIFLTPLGGRSVVLLNDHLTDCREEVAGLRYNAALDSMELAAYRAALSQAASLQELTEARLSETVAQVDRCEVREAQLEKALNKASKRGKRWRFIAAVAGVVAVVEGAIIAVVAR